MKNYLYTLTAILLFQYSSEINAQDKGSLYDLLIRNDSSSVIEPYSKILDKEFTKILTGQNTNFGSFASLATKDDIATLSGHVPISKKSSIGINLKGGVNEGIVSLLNGEDVSSNLSIGIQLNFGIYGISNKKSVTINATELKSFQSTVDSLGIENSKIRYKIDAEYDKIRLNIEKFEYEIKLKNKNLDKLHILRDSLSKENSLTVDSINLLLYSTELDIQDLHHKIDLQSQEANRITSDYKRHKIEVWESKKQRIYKNQLSKLELLEYELKWFAISTNLNNRSFKLLNSSNNYSNTIFNGIELGVSYNKYQLKDKFFGTYFISYGISYLIDDNFDDLTKMSYVDKQEISSAPNQKYTETKKTVYSGEYDDDISHFRFTINSYIFLGYKKLFAFHFNPSYRSIPDTDDKFDLTTGILIGLINKEKKNNIINAELFYDMKDLFHKKEDKNDQLSDRSNLGIRLSFPISFNQN